MWFLRRWRNIGVALCVALVAFPAVLMAQGDHVVLDYGNIETSSPIVNLQSNLIVTAYGGCLAAGQIYDVRRYDKPGGTARMLPVNSFDRSAIVPWGVIDVQIGSLTPNASKAVEGGYTAKYELVGPEGGVVDVQTVIVLVRANVTYKPNGSAGWIFNKSARAIVSMKPGGPITGKVRMPQPTPEDPTPPEPNVDVDIFTDNTDYAIEPGTGRVVQNPIPNYDFGNGVTGQFPNGAGWTRVSVPASQVANGGVPTAFKAAYPNGGRLESGPSGIPSFMGSNRKVGGQARSPITGGSVTVGSDGSTHVNGWGSGDYSGVSLSFPPGYEPVKPPGDPPPATGGDTSNVDPCFSAALELENLGGGGGPSDPPLPPGMQPGNLPLPPGMTAGTGVALPPGMTPAGGGNGGPTIGDPPLPSGGGNGGTGGAGGTGGGLLGGGGGVGPLGPDPPLPPNPPLPDPGGGPGDGIKLPTGPAGGALPDVGAAESEADAMAKGLANRVGQIEAKAKALMTWGKVSPVAAGNAGAWTVNLPISGSSYTMTIPTDNAPLIRALFLVLMTATFLGGVLKLLLQ